MAKFLAGSAIDADSVYCGDALELIHSVPDNSADMVFMDPPYGHNNNSNGDLIARREAALGKGDYIAKRDDRPITNDGAEANEVLAAILPEIKRVLVPGGCCCCCCCGGGGPDPQFARWSLMLDEAIGFKMAVVWDKGPMGMGWHYRRSYEMVLIAQKPGAACRWFDDSNKVENIIRHIRKVIPRSDQHPTEKPIGLAQHFIRLHSRAGDLVLDPFAGSGTTLIAAKQEGRRYLGFEIDEHWAGVAERRVSEAVYTPTLL